MPAGVQDADFAAACLTLSHMGARETAVQTDVITLDERSLDQVVASASTPLVVRFWAPWCASCRVLTPSFIHLSRAYAECVRFGEVNVEENSLLARRFSVRTIPTILVLHRGVVVGHITAPRSAVRLQQIIDVLV